MIAVGYVVALFWAVLPLVGFGNYGFEPYGLSCTLDWVAKDRGKLLKKIISEVCLLMAYLCPCECVRNGWVVLAKI